MYLRHPVQMRRAGLEILAMTATAHVVAR